MSTNSENLAVATGLEKVSFHSNHKERQCQRILKLPHNCTHLTLWQSGAQNLQARLQQYVNWELPDVWAGFRKGRGTRDQIANICWIIEKVREFQKNIYFCFINYAKAFDCWSQQTGKFFKRWDYHTILPISWETWMQVKKQQLELDMKHLTGSKLGKEYDKVVYHHPVYLTYMQST